MGTTQYQEESGNTGNFTSAEQAEKIKRLDELISKSKEEKAVYDLPPLETHPALNSMYPLQQELFFYVS